jgi:hexokinase
VDLSPSTKIKNGENPLSPNGFVNPGDGEGDLEQSRVRRILEKSWPIGEQLKHEKAEDLFAWIGECIAEVVEDGMRLFPETLQEELTMGVTFSFPMM